MHSWMTTILNRILHNHRTKGKKDGEIILPLLFTRQLYSVSKKLGIQASMALNYVGNWYPLNDIYKENPESFSFEDFHLCWFLTEEK